MFDTFTPKQIYQATPINEVTGRAWQNRNDPPLRTSGHMVGKHRRYDFADAMRFRILRDLVFDFDMDGSKAVALVNQSYDTIGSFAAQYVNEAKINEGWRNSAGPWLVIRSGRPGFELCRTVGALTSAILGEPHEPNEKGEIKTRDVLLTGIVLDLGRIAHSTVYALSSLDVAALKDESEA